jgi:predicted aspartyl protease
MGPLSSLEGKIVKRNFDASGLNIVGIVIEEPSGERLFVNIDAFQNLEKDNVDLADRGWIVKGLQTLLRQGTSISAEAQLCGASGHVMMLDGVYIARNTRREAPTAAVTHLQNPPKAQRGPAPHETYVAMQAEGGTFVVPVQINGILTLNFTIDSGAADVSVPADIVMTLMRTRTLTSTDILDKQTYQLADGSRVPSQRFVIRSLKVGNKVLHDVTGNVAPVRGVPLLGQSFLSRFKSWSIDNGRHVLILR